MKKIIVHEFISLDGVIQAPGGKNEDLDGGFEHGGWTIPYWHDDIGLHFDNSMKQADTLLLGRKTWVTHGEAFEKMAGDPFADALNGMKKYVVSTTLQSPDLWRNSTIISSKVEEEVRKLKEMPGKDILIDGSSVLLHTLIKDGLVDEFMLHVYPLSLGGGKKLFPEGVRVNLKLTESKSLPTGVVFEKYTVEK
jgi:dihydrofolate reductase